MRCQPRVRLETFQGRMFPISGAVPATDLSPALHTATRLLHINITRLRRHYFQAETTATHHPSLRGSKVCPHLAPLPCTLL